jgi:hypothetical protein
MDLTKINFTPTSFGTTSSLTTLHPKSDGYFSFFFENYKPNHDLELSFDSFKLAMGETLYRLTSRVLCFQFCEAFVTHFSPHQFGVATKGGYEIVIHGIMCTLNFHSN